MSETGEDGGDPGTASGPLAGRVAVVTGGSRGIGLAAARALLQRGARTAILARGSESLAEARAALGESVLALGCDVADPQAVHAALDEIESRWQRLDILVNSAAVATPGRIEELAPDEVRRQVDVNLLGSVHCARAAIPLLRRTGGGVIVFVSSESAPEPYPWLGIYAATKAAVETFARALREEVRADAIRVTLVRPGPTVTSFARDWDPAVAREAVELWNSLGVAAAKGVLMPDVVGEAIAWAASVPPEACVHELDLRPA